MAMIAGRKVCIGELADRVLIRSLIVVFRTALLMRWVFM
jgi:hypothetical protein